MTGSRMALAIAMCMLPIAGCGKKYSPGCKQSVELTAPFSSMNLPVGDGRVCESDGKRAKLEFVGSDQGKWRGAVESSLLGVGFAKDSCPSYCIYTRGSERLQVIVGDIGNKWVTVSLIMSAGRGSDARPSSGSADADPPKKASSAVTNDVDSIPECKAYFDKLLACPPAKGPVSRQEEANIKKKSLQERLGKGTSTSREIVRESCETLEKVLKCG